MRGRKRGLGQGLRKWKWESEKTGKGPEQGFRWAKESESTAGCGFQRYSSRSEFERIWRCKAVREREKEDSVI